MIPILKKWTVTGMKQKENHSICMAHGIPDKIFQFTKNDVRISLNITKALRKSKSLLYFSLLNKDALLANIQN